MENFDNEAIVDTSNPHVLHIIYPNGKKLTKEELDPNVGGFIPRDGSVDIWATQESFE